MQLADLGHPVIGPQSYSKLTHGEIRIYAEGLSERKRRQDEAGEGRPASAGGRNLPDAGSGVPGTGGRSPYQRQSQQKRDEAALERAHGRAVSQTNGST